MIDLDTTYKVVATIVSATIILSIISKFFYRNTLLSFSCLIILIMSIALLGTDDIMKNLINIAFWCNVVIVVILGLRQCLLYINEECDLNKDCVIIAGMLIIPMVIIRFLTNPIHSVLVSYFQREIFEKFVCTYNLSSDKLMFLSQIIVLLLLLLWQYVFLESFKKLF